MAKALKAWRMLAVASAAALALALVASAFAQAPPSPPHQFFGSSETGSGAQIDGADAADGAVVAAWNENGDQVGSDTITAGTWLIQVDAAEASTVTFTVDGNADSQSFDVVSGSLTEAALNASSEAAPPAVDDGAPDALPSTGSGGLAGGSGSSVPVLPLALVAAVVMALGGVAVTRRSLR